MAKKSTFAQKILLLSILKGKTQAELAKGIGMLPNNLNHYLRGHREIQSRHFVNILRELGLDIEESLNREIAAMSEMKLQEKVRLGDAMESVVKALRPTERKTLLRHMARMAQVSLGARSKQNIETIRVWAR